MTNYLNTYEVASMRGDLNNTQLSMRCTIERFVATGTNPDNHPTGSWEVLHEDLPCWYWEQVLRTLLEEREGPVNVTEAYPQMILPANTDIETEDRITSVTNFEGLVVATDLNIRVVLHRMLDVLLTVEEHS